MKLAPPTECPACHGKLEKGATACGCGRKITAADLVPAVKSVCCDLTNMCDRPAKVSILVEGKRLNACMVCYHAHQDAELRAFDAKKTAEERRQNRENAEKLLGIGQR